MSKNSTIFPRIAMASVIIAVLCLMLFTEAAFAETISFSPAEKSVAQGSNTTFDIVLDSAPKGLAGYEVNVSLSDPAIGEITGVQFPDWAMLNKNGSFPSDDVMISGVDLGRKVDNGSTNVLLATVTVQGDKVGTADVNVTVKEIDAIGGSAIPTVVTAGRLDVVQGQAGTTNTAGASATSSSAAGSATAASGSGGIDGPVLYIVIVIVLVVLAVVGTYLVTQRKK